MFKTIHVAGGAGLILSAGLLAQILFTTAIAQPAPPEGGPLHKLHRLAPPAFADIDSNKDGAISPAEFDAFHDKHMPRDGAGEGPPPEFHGHRGPADIKSLDKNGDGKISLEEFGAPMKAHFARLDANHDGVLDASEWSRGPGGDGPPPPLPGN